MAKKPVKNQDPDTTGHSWDGIEEFNNPLPKWWLWIFYATIVWGIWYTIAYPAWPGIKDATAGYLGYSTRAEVAAEIAAAEAQNAEINERLASVELSAITEDDELSTYATSAGNAVFKTWCAQCHQTNGAGAKGYPNLQDDAWLWGGTMEDIHQTLLYGIRHEEYIDTRFSQMPAFGDDYLPEEEIEQVVNYVMSLTPNVNPPKNPEMVEAGEVVYMDNCAACHMEDASGDQFQGAPNLADAIWLYGGDYEALYDTVYNSRYGVMPGWENRLSEAEIRAVATYVHQLGGGE
ncbi:cytochrome-c oxidase, cbb3-type subunit III [Rhodobacteraceae bacterium 63075]|nr:cytochrome-c oxidase, cbb3-type subunit III [Rhodobacteraceae bacterium 63075]